LENNRYIKKTVDCSPIFATLVKAVIFHKTINLAIEKQFDPKKEVLAISHLYSRQSPPLPVVIIVPSVLPSIPSVSLIGFSVWSSQWVS
jgi:hypothetical protein